MIDELDRLLFSPYRQIIEKAKTAVQNFENVGDKVPSHMLKTAKALLEDGERALKVIGPLSTSYYEHYGRIFVDVLKEHDKIAEFRCELEDLLWDFDDFIEVESFTVARFVLLQEASKRAALGILDILKRLTFSPVLISPPGGESTGNSQRHSDSMKCELRPHATSDFLTIPSAKLINPIEGLAISNFRSEKPSEGIESGDSTRNDYEPHLGVSAQSRGSPTESSSTWQSGGSKSTWSSRRTASSWESRDLIPHAKRLSMPLASSSNRIELMDAANSPALTVSPQQPDCTITPSSSFYMLGGFCRGAEEARQGQLGFKKLQRVVRGNTTLVARCTHCLFELDFGAVQRDLNNESSEIFKSNTVAFRLRVLQKCHLSLRSTAEQVYGCPFCIQQRHTTEESDATVFLSQRTLFMHMARHPQPLPIVAGITVIEGAELLPHLKNKFDLHFPNPPMASVTLGVSKEILRLPTAIAIDTKTADRTALQFSVGAKIVGIEFPEEYRGEWAIGWHNGVRAAFEMEAVQLIVPPQNYLQVQGTTRNCQAVARWGWNQKSGDDRWLKFKEGDVISNITWVGSYWCWSGVTSRGRRGIFPQSHLEPNSIRYTDFPFINDLSHKENPGRSSIRDPRSFSGRIDAIYLKGNVDGLFRGHYKSRVSDRDDSALNDLTRDLRELGLSEQIIELLNLGEMNGAIDASTLNTSKGMWLDYLANRLGDIYSDTGTMDIAEAAVKLAVSYNSTNVSTLRDIKWLNDLGVQINPSWAWGGNPGPAKAAIFEWEIPSIFCSQDPNSSGDNVDLRAELRDFVVLNGSDGVFEATTCVQYIEDKFGAAGLEVFDIVVDVLTRSEFSAFLTKRDISLKQPASRLEKRAGAVKAERASRSCITLTTQTTPFDPRYFACMKWLCEALREIPAPSSLEAKHHSWLMKSRMSPCLQLGRGETLTPAITIFSLKPLEPLTDREIGRDCCWTKLFKSAVIAWTPLIHTWGTGLRLSYEMLIRLAAVTNYVCVDNSASGPLSGKGTGGLVAVGFFTALIPIAYDPVTNSTQWHLEVTDNSIIEPEKLKTLKGNWLQMKNPNTFSGSKCFLGWKGNVNVTLGTRKGCYDLQWTDLPKVERTFHLEGFEIGGEIGIGDIIPISLKHAGNLSFKARSTVQSFTAISHYEQAIRILSHHVALVYDSESSIAWLVPQLSWTLHLCHVWYRHIHKNQALHDPVPFANASTDGSSASREVLCMQGDLAILPGLNLNQLLLQIYRNMTSSNQYRQKPGKSRIFGTEIMDLIEEPGVGSLLRKLDLPEVDQSWQYLAAKADNISFCKGLGQALEPRDKDPNHTCGCDAIPSNRSLLVAHSLCVERLLMRESINLNALQNSIVNLDDGKVWFMENWPFDTCSHHPEEDYWTAANISLQRISKPKRWNSNRKTTDWKGHCSPLPMTGAFVFGNPPYTAFSTNKISQKKEIFFVLPDLTLNFGLFD